MKRKNLVFIILLAVILGSCANEPLSGGLYGDYNPEFIKINLGDIPPEFKNPVNISHIEETRYLELINGDYRINGEPDKKYIVSAWPAVPVSTTEVMLHETAIRAVEELRNEAREEQAGTFYISSGYRDYEMQRQVYNNVPDKAFVQPPGHSEHHTGLAADILAIGLTLAEMAESSEGQWLNDNSWKYGLIVRYAENKRHITGIAYEPWHFRYVGQPHAWFMKQNNLCFEEYIEFLKEISVYQAEFNGVTYTVSYQEPQNNMIYVPKKINFDISSDNTGGYIITSRE